jgi:hypothetical protein
MAPPLLTSSYLRSLLAVGCNGSAALRLFVGSLASVNAAKARFPHVLNNNCAGDSAAVQIRRLWTHLKFFFLEGGGGMQWFVGQRRHETEGQFPLKTDQQTTRVVQQSGPYLLGTRN